MYRLLSLVGLLQLVSLSAYGQIQLPGGGVNLTEVDTGSKNSGGNTDVLNPENGYVHIQATVHKKGAHLASAAAGLRAAGNETAAFAVSQLSSVETTFGAVQQAAAASLYPYLQYWRGGLFTEPFSVYLIYYGTWLPKNRVIIEDFVKSLGSQVKYGKAGANTVKNWWGINVRYYANHARTKVTSKVRLGGVFVDKYSRGAKGTALNPLTQDDIRRIVARAVTPGPRRLPLDPKGAYMVLTSEDVHMVDFCNGMCAYHTSAMFKGVHKLAFAFVGNARTQCPGTCTYRYFDATWQGSNGDVGVDGVIDKIGHELAEIATNPWHGPRDIPGYVVANSEIENADLCEWEYGEVAFPKTNAFRAYNLEGVNGRKFMVQLNFNRRTQKCVLQSDD